MCSRLSSLVGCTGRSRPCRRTSTPLSSYCCSTAREKCMTYSRWGTAAMRRKAGSAIDACTGWLCRVVGLEVQRTRSCLLSQQAHQHAPMSHSPSHTCYRQVSTPQYTSCRWWRSRSTTCSAGPRSARSRPPPGRNCLCPAWGRSLGAAGQGQQGGAHVSLGVRSRIITG